MLRVSGKIPTGCRDESVSLRLCRRPSRALPLHGGASHALPQSDLRAVDRSDRHARGIAARAGGHLLSENVPAPERSADGGAARDAGADGFQMQRQGKLNSRLSTAEVVAICRLDRESRFILRDSIDRLGLSARAYHRVLKLARTCADLAGAADIRSVDVSEAVKLRALDRACG